MGSCLREMLLRVVAGSQVPPPAYSKIDSEVAEFTKSFMVAHLNALRSQGRDRGLYEAGCACKDAPVAQLNLAFLFLNRFLDICDAIEDDNTEIDNSDFLQTDLPSPC